MNKENRYDIVNVFNELCARDPWWRYMYSTKFKTLYDGWRRTELRHQTHTDRFYTIAWNRGWLPKADGQRFRDYAMQ